MIVLINARRKEVRVECTQGRLLTNPRIGVHYRRIKRRSQTLWRSQNGHPQVPHQLGIRHTECNAILQSQSVHLL